MIIKPTSSAILAGGFQNRQKGRKMIVQKEKKTTNLQKTVKKRRKMNLQMKHQLMKQKKIPLLKQKMKKTPEEIP